MKCFLMCRGSGPALRAVLLQRNLIPRNTHRDWPTMNAKILLAEDDNDMRRFLVKALENAGYVVSSYDNGLSAYDRLREEPFELLLTDIVMPEMDGIELARRATELDPDIKVMFITGFAAVALQPRFACAQGCEGSLQALPPQGSRQRGWPDVAAGGLTAAPAGFSLPLAQAAAIGPAHAGLLTAGRARSSAGEHYLDMVGVTGSIPVAPTNSQAPDVAGSAATPGLVFCPHLFLPLSIAKYGAAASKGPPVA